MNIKAFLKGIIRKKEAKNASWIIGAKIIKMVFSLIVSIITARYLGPNNFGLIGYATTYVTFFGVICTLGYDSVIIKEFYDHPSDEGTALGSALLFREIISIVSIFIIIGIVAILDKGEKETLLVVFLCSVGLLFQVFDSFNYWFQSKYNSKIVAVGTLIAYIFISLYKIALYLLKKDVYWFAVSNAIDYLCIGLILVYCYKKYTGPKLHISAKKGFNMLRSSYHYILSGLMVAVYGQTDRLMLKQMIGESEVGYYTLAVQICSMWVFVLAAIIESMYPTILHSYNEGNLKKFNRDNKMLYSLVFYLSVFVSLLITIFAGVAIRFVYGNAYDGSVMPLRIITWYTAFSYLGVARNAWIVCEGKQKYLKYMYGIAAITNIFLNFILIPVWGASGAALASLITQLLTSIGLPLLIREMRPNAMLMINAILLKGMLKKKRKIDHE